MKFMTPTVCLFLTSLLMSATASGEDYPRKPIRFLVPFAPGGGADFTARVYGKHLSELWGQTVVVDAAYVDGRLAELSQDEDLSRFIL